YSRGMLQRIGLAQALLRDPDLLFLDEPASGTDPRGVALVRERILEAKARGATIVLNSHQLAEVERVCDRIVFIDRGRLARGETLRRLFATRPACRHPRALGPTGRGRRAPLGGRRRSGAGSRRNGPTRRGVRRRHGARDPRDRDRRRPRLRGARCGGAGRALRTGGRGVIEMVRRFLRQRFGSPGLVAALAVLALL